MDSADNSRDAAHEPSGSGAAPDADALLAAIVGSAEDAIWSKGLDGVVTTWNAAAERLFGYDASEIVGRSISVLVPRERAAEEADILARVARAERLEHFETERLRKDGQRVSVSATISPVRDRAGEVVGVCTILRDVGERRRQEEALARDHEQRYLVLFDRAPFAIALLTLPERTLVTVNDAFLALFGYERDEALGRTPVELGIADEDEAARVFALVQEQGRIRQLEVTRRTKSGRRVPLSLSAEVVSFGERRMLLATFEDITERKRLEAEVSARDLRFRALVAELNDVIWSASPDGKVVVNVNQSFERIYGRSSADLERNPALWSEVVHPDDRAIAQRSAQTLFTEGRAEAEYRIVRPDGTVRWMRDRKALVRDADGHPVLMGGVGTDVTEQRQLSALTRAERDWGLALAGATTLHEGLAIGLDAALAASGLDVGGIFLLDSATGALHLAHHRGLSPEFAAATAICPADSSRTELVLRGQPMYTHSPELDELGEARRREGLRACAVIPIREGDRIIGCLNAASRQHDEIPGVSRHALETMVALLGSGIQRLRTEDALRSLNAELEERVQARTRAAEAANLAKSVFLANMSHEIRTPLNAILGFAQLLRRERGLTEAQAQYVDTILRSGERLLGLLTDILELSKIEAGRLRVDEAVFDLHEVLADLEATFGLRAANKDLRLLVEHDPATPRYVATDEGRLRQVLGNLLSNAVKFTERGGVAMRVAVTLDEAAPVGHRLVAEVEDTGVGIAPEEIGRLFRVFEQTESGRRERSGTGLGLALSERVARLLGGKLEVRSELGRGSTFRLEIPVRVGSAAEARPTSRPPRVVALEPGQPTIRVLIADDRADNRTFLERLLGAVGFAVRAVENGELAVREFGAWRPQLVLMDLHMPVLSGGAAIGRIRELPGGEAARIIAVTASGWEDDRQEAIESGADDFLGKPFREDVLLEKIRGLLGVRYVVAADDLPTTPPPPAAEGSAALRAEVERLPADLVVRLREATLRADLDRILELAGQAETGSPALADEIRRLGAEFQYGELAELLSLRGEPS